MAAVLPLIDPGAVYSSHLGVFDEELPLASRTLVGTKGTVVAVYPVGHPDNPSGQTLVDVQPTSDLPILTRVPVAHAYAHEETAVQAPHTARRNAWEPRARNRMEGACADLRHGTFVWVSFLGGSIHDPVVTATLGFNQKPAREAPAYLRLVDVIDDDGNLVPTPHEPLDTHQDGNAGYPRRVEAYNGVRDEVTNRGSRYIQTSVDREPIFPGHGKLAASGEPEGNFGVSTRGAKVGHLGFTTGADPLTGDTSGGRHFRRSIGAEDGSIRDTTNSRVGHIIRRIRAGIGRMWESAAGGSDGRWYAESRGRAYVALGADGAEVAGDQVVLDGGTVMLGSGEAADAVVLWPQLNQLLAQLWQAIDQHTHTDVMPGSSNTGAPTVPTFAATWSGGAEQCKAADVLAAQTNAPSPEPQDDPEG